MTTTLWQKSGDRQLKKVAFAAAVGAKVHYFVGGTTTPLTTYTDAAANTPHNTASLVTDGNGQWPMIFVPYGAFDYRILDSDNTIITTATNVPNPAPIDPTTTDPNALMQTGDMIFSPAAATRAGFVRSNGNTIGSGASSGTERANDDAEALFAWIWNNTTNDQAAVTGGRGASAAADWSANKTIATLDFRGSSPIGLDDMGASAASRFDSTPFTNGNATAGGAVTGSNTVTLDEANLPAHVHAAGAIATDAAGAHFHGAGSILSDADGAHFHGTTDPGHTHVIQDYRTNVVVERGDSSPFPDSSVVQFGGATSFISDTNTTGITINQSSTHTHTTSGNTATSDNHTHTTSGNSASVGSGTATNIVQRSVLGTWLLKL